MAQINTYIDDSQHGFRKLRSTITSHVSFADDIASPMDSTQQVDAVYFDYKKAFDLVDNGVLLVKDINLVLCLVC